MTVENFLKRFVEGYLFHDLESMAKITVPHGQDDGGVGYPMIATVLAGMELLGNLLLPNTDPFDANKGSDYFLNYWDNYFTHKNPSYTGLGRLFRKLMRNGISHNFVAKTGIFVEKGTNRQTSIDINRKEMYIDCNVFFKEFEESYWKGVKPIINGTASSPLTSKVTMQTRLDDLAKAYSNESMQLFSGLPQLHPSMIISSKRGQVPVSSFFTSLGVKNSGASAVMQSSSVQSAPIVTTYTTTSSINNNATASFPSKTEPFSSPSGAFPPKNKT